MPVFNFTGSSSSISLIILSLDKVLGVISSTLIESLIIVDSSTLIVELISFISLSIDSKGSINWLLNTWELSNTFESYGLVISLVNCPDTISSDWLNSVTDWSITLLSISTSSLTVLFTILSAELLIVSSFLMTSLTCTVPDSTTGWLKSTNASSTAIEAKGSISWVSDGLILKEIFVLFLLLSISLLDNNSNASFRLISMFDSMISIDFVSFTSRKLILLHWFDSLFSLFSDLIILFVDNASELFVSVAAVVLTDRWVVLSSMINWFELSANESTTNCLLSNVLGLSLLFISLAEE